MTQLDVAAHPIPGEPYSGGYIAPSLPSTNIFVRENWQLFEPWEWLVATRQTAGHGRLGRTWDAPPSTSLLVTVLVPTTGDPARVSFAAALALSRVIESELPAPEPELKWPNDIFLAGKKVAGILSEHLDYDGQTHWLAVGAGLNLTVPTDLLDRYGATSLQQHGWTGPVTKPVLAELANRFSHHLAEAATSPTAVADFASRCILQGKQVTAITAAERQIHGKVNGISPRGELIIGNEAVAAADVTIKKSTF